MVHHDIGHFASSLDSKKGMQRLLRQFANAAVIAR